MPAPVVPSAAYGKPVRVRLTATGPGLPSVAVSAPYITNSLTSPVDARVLLSPVDGRVLLRRL